ncbi:MAG: molybdate ABC transporter substrate-binding protein [Planctomycetota bacterium]
MTAAAWTRLLSAATLALASCAGDARPTVRVFAAASLTAPFGELVEAFGAAHPELRVELHCAGTPQLVMQLREGAPADVFASADRVQMDRVVAAGRAAGAPRVFAGNTLSIVTPPENRAGVASLEDLARDGVVALLCAPSVPAGRYARDALTRAGVTVTSASDEPSVRAVISKVALGVADAGVVYRTDALAAAERVQALPIAAPHNVTASYPIVATSAGAEAEHGQAFVAFVLGETGRRVLARHGFTAP